MKSFKKYSGHRRKKDAKVQTKKRSTVLIICENTIIGVALLGLEMVAEATSNCRLHKLWCHG